MLRRRRQLITPPATHKIINGTRRYSQNIIISFRWPSQRFGAVHVVCNNTGVASDADPWFGPISTWRWVLGVNLWGVIHRIPREQLPESSRHEWASAPGLGDV
jgi:NAD(P)-dependent dehydrogenase (short-subunit alcohol dehydrogenase family)